LSADNSIMLRVEKHWSKLSFETEIRQAIRPGQVRLGARWGDAMLESGGLRFVPSRVEGLPHVSDVVVYPDRVELLSAGRWTVFDFTDIAEWPRPAFLRRSLARLGWRPRWLPVGERDWFHPPSARFFRFYTQPRVVIYLPDEPQATDYGNTLFRRIQHVMREQRFDTWDLG
jgi:hypothetical protein